MRSLLFLLLAAALLAPTVAAAHSHKAKALEIVHPWTRETPDKAPNDIIVCMTIKNRGTAGDRLLGASTPLATRVEIRGPGGGAPEVIVAASKTVDLKRDGTHLLLTGFKRKLNAYESFAMTLQFEKAGKVVVEVAVEELEQPKSQ